MAEAKRFEGKTMIVTGAAGGIGYATAEQAAREGARLVLADRKERESGQALAKLKQISPDVDFLIMDLKDEKNCGRLIDLAWEKYGSLDVLVNNAGAMGIPAPVHAMTTEMFDEVMGCNIYTAFFCSRAALGKMMGQGRDAAIVNVSSVAGLRGFPGHAAYVAAKHALSGLTKNMALDYAKYGIRVNAVNPGTIRTPIYEEAKAFLESQKRKQAVAPPPAGGLDAKVCPPKFVSAQARVAEAGEVAAAILFLAGSEASNITGVTLPVDGGFVCF